MQLTVIFAVSMFSACLAQTVPCCESGSAFFDLNSGSYYNGLSGVTVDQTPTSQYLVRSSCSKVALLKVNFEKMTSSSCVLVDGCLAVPYCGRRMLKIELMFSSGDRSGHLLNVGDSVSNTAYKGDANHQDNDATFDIIYPHAYAWSSDLCNLNSSLYQLATYSNAASSSVMGMTLYVSDKHIRVKNDNGLDQSLCHNCLFALKGQPDSSSGGVNEDVYIGFNQVIHRMSHGTGRGLCRALLTWECPW